jgi:hypothetical protein
VSTPNSYRFDQKNCWVLNKKDKQGPSLAPQVNPECLGAQAGRTLSAVKPSPTYTPCSFHKSPFFMVKVVSVGCLVTRYDYFPNNNNINKLYKPYDIAWIGKAKSLCKV